MLAVGTVSQLRERLQRAVEHEQFELAAALRDQLKAIQ
jgi:protein-arginine kinase activator protein McsA